MINKVILPVGEDETLTGRAKVCGRCGYLHPLSGSDGPDLCERCAERLDAPLSNLFRMQNVSTKRRDRINCDEEERMRLGYDIRTGVRFAVHQGEQVSKTAALIADGQPFARVCYGHAATMWRINRGWRNRENRALDGFVLDTERGYWQKNSLMTDDPDDPLSPKVARVIPYVEDRRNCLLFEPDGLLSPATMASLQAALKSAIQVRYQLEDNELAVEPLPDRDMRRVLLFYEAAEGGAGVLRQLVDDPHAWAEVAREALTLCHFDPDTGEDQRRARADAEPCEAACYDCLMSYYNQQDHKLLDRQGIVTVLRCLASASVKVSPGARVRHEHLAALRNLCDSDLERAWLVYLETHDLRLPSHAQVLIEACGTRPDFLYEEHHVAVYIDGPHHDYPERQARDATQTAVMEDAGYTVIRFGYQDDWDPLVRKYPYLFGTIKTS